MNPKLAKKLADQFQELSDTLMAISGTFRSAGEGGDDTGGDDETGAAVRKPAAKSKSAAAPAKPAAKGKAKAESQESDVSEDDVREALQALAEAKGKGALVAALASVGAGALKEVDESQYAELIEKANEMAESEDEYDEDGEVEGAKPAAKGKKAAPAAKGKTKKPAATKESATEKFTELAESDVDAAKVLLKELGVKKFSMLDDDETDWNDVTAQIEAAMDGDGGLV